MFKVKYFILIIFKFTVLKSDITVIIRFILLLFWAALEYIRLQSGMNGNIKEWFPELISFLLLTFINLLLLVVMLFYGIIIPLEKSLLIIQIIFFLLQIIAM